MFFNDTLNIVSNLRELFTGTSCHSLSHTLFYQKIDMHISIIQHTATRHNKIQYSTSQPDITKYNAAYHSLQEAQNSYRTLDSG